MVGIRDLLLVNFKHVVNHVRLKFLKACLGLHGPFEEIGLGRLVFGVDEAINLVGPSVILCQNGLTGHFIVVGVEQVGDVFLVLSIFFKFVDEVEDCCLLDELGNCVDVQEDAISY